MITTTEPLTGHGGDKELPPLGRVVRQIQDNTATIHDIQKAVEDTIAHLEGQRLSDPTSEEKEPAPHEGTMNQLRFEVGAQSKHLTKLQETVASLNGLV